MCTSQAVIGQKSFNGSLGQVEYDNGRDGVICLATGQGDLISNWLILSKIIALKLPLEYEGARLFLSKKIAPKLP
jgi:hypothetical protein